MTKAVKFQQARDREEYIGDTPETLFKNAEAFAKTFYYSALIRKAKNGTWHGKHFRVQKEIDALAREFGDTRIPIEYDDGEPGFYKDAATAYVARFIINEVPDTPIVLRASEADHYLRDIIPICAERMAEAEENLAQWVTERPDSKWADDECEGQEEIIYMEEVPQ